MGKIKSKRTTQLLVLFIFISFFTSTFSQLLLSYNTELIYFFENTFLEPIINGFQLFVPFLFQTIKFTSMFIFVLSLISLFIIFYEDFIQEKSMFKF